MLTRLYLLLFAALAFFHVVQRISQRLADRKARRRVVYVQPRIAEVPTAFRKAQERDEIGDRW